MILFMGLADWTRKNTKHIRRVSSTPHFVFLSKGEKRKGEEKTNTDGCSRDDDFDGSIYETKTKHARVEKEKPNKHGAVLTVDSS